MTTGQGVSLKPSDAVQGGGLFDDVDATITQCRFKSWDYNGAIKSPVLGLGVTFQNEDADGFTFEQVYSAGNLQHFVPSDDGRFAVPVGTLTGLQESSNAMAFLKSLVNCGFPEDKIERDISVFEGCKVHVNRVPQQQRKGLDQAGAKAKDILVVTKIHSLPGEAGKAVAAGAGKKAAAPAKAKAATASVAASSESSSGNGHVHQKAVETLLSILAAKGGSVKKLSVAQEAFKLLATDPDRNAVCQIVFKDEFLSEAGQPWSFDGQTVAMGG